MENISVVVINLNEEQQIGHLLEDLAQQTYQGFEVILVNLDSDDITCEIAKDYQDRLPELTLHKMEGRSVSIGRNTGASLAKYERILFLDADIRLSNDFLSRALNKLQDKQLEVAGIYMSAKKSPLAHKLGFGMCNLGFFATQYFFPTAVGACLFSTKTVHERVGGFDESIVLCEECDYVNRGAKTWRFRFLPLTFEFNSRKLEQNGHVKTGLTYLKANMRRFLFGEIRSNQMDCPCNHVKDPSQ
ncbi:beta-1,3-glucosyltransferase [Vibrio astriarenae]|nr:beta-1,3-glucosyltransferase [Vibrio sp. C7]